MDPRKTRARESTGGKAHRRPYSAQANWGQIGQARSPKENEDRLVHFAGCSNLAGTEGASDRTSRPDQALDDRIALPKLSNTICDHFIENYPDRSANNASTAPTIKDSGPNFSTDNLLSNAIDGNNEPTRGGDAIPGRAMKEDHEPVQISDNFASGGPSADDIKHVSGASDVHDTEDSAETDIELALDVTIAASEALEEKNEQSQRKRTATTSLESLRHAKVAKRASPLSLAAFESTTSAGSAEAPLQGDVSH